MASTMAAANEKCLAWRSFSWLTKISKFRFTALAKKWNHYEQYQEITDSEVQNPDFHCPPPFFTAATIKSS
jgi:hypothetical protein